MFTGIFSRSGFVICIEYFSALEAVNGVHISIITETTNEFIPDTLIQTAKISYNYSATGYEIFRTSPQVNMLH